MKHYRPVFVIFDDHVSRPSWHRRAPTKAVKVFATGWVVSETRKTLTLSGQITQTGEMGDCMTILKSCIRKRSRLSNQAIRRA